MTTQSDVTGIYTGFPITTAFDFADYRIERSLGACFGLVVRSMGAARGIAASFKSLAGGEVGQYTKLLEDSRRHAMDRLVENARILGANGIIGMRFDSSEIGQSLTEIAAYGTAVVIAPRQA
ncbi:MAG TPA: YbjQ family protein [Acidimicrobiales bacterium]|nr:YbjQ family protein [Acidimicrobiales bacterium]